MEDVDVDEEFSALVKELSSDISPDESTLKNIWEPQIS